MATTTRSGHSKRKSLDIPPESALQRFTSRITKLTTWEKLRDLESRKSVRVVCLISGVALLTGVVAAFIVWSGWIENEAPLKSLASVQEVKPISAHLSRVIQSPQSLKVIHHGKAPAIYSGDCTPPECRTGPITLLVLVESLPTSYGFRMAVRNSWMQYGSADVFVRFAVAGKRLHKSTLNTHTASPPTPIIPQVPKGLEYPAGQLLLCLWLGAQPPLPAWGCGGKQDQDTKAL